MIWAEIDREWRALAQAISVKAKELEQLRHRFNELDELRVSLLKRGGGVDPTLELLYLRSLPKVKTSLQDVLIELLASSKSPLLAGDVLDLMDESIKARYASRRSLVASVHTTLKRLAVSGRITITVSKQGPFFGLPATDVSTGKVQDGR